MVEMPAAIAPQALRELVATGNVAQVRVKAGGTDVLIATLHAGGNERVVGAARGGPRFWKSIDGAVSTLKDYGINEFVVDASGWIPRTVRAA